MRQSSSGSTTTSSTPTTSSSPTPRAPRTAWRPLAKVLDDNFGIRKGVMTTVHAYTNDQVLADVPHQDLRRSRAATENIIPTTHRRRGAIGLVIPDLEGQARRDGDAGPVPDGSTVDLVAELDVT